MAEVIKSNGSLELTGKSSELLKAYLAAAEKQDGRAPDSMIFANQSLQNGVRAKARAVAFHLRTTLGTKQIEEQARGGDDASLGRLTKFYAEQIKTFDAIAK